MYLYLDEKKYIVAMGSEEEENSVYVPGVPAEVDQYFDCYQYIDGEYVPDYDRIAWRINRERIEMEAYEISVWFTWYDTQVAQYTRCMRLGQEYDKDIDALDKEAAQKQLRLREIKEEMARAYGGE